MYSATVIGPEIYGKTNIHLKSSDSHRVTLIWWYSKCMASLVVPSPPIALGDVEQRLLTLHNPATPPPHNRLPKADMLV